MNNNPLRLLVATLLSLSVIAGSVFTAAAEETVPPTDTVTAVQEVPVTEASEETKTAEEPVTVPEETAVESPTKSPAEVPTEQPTKPAVREEPVKEPVDPRKVVTSCKGLDVKRVDGKWTVVKGSDPVIYTGIAQNKNGWWYCKNGYVDFKKTSIEKNDYGWWRVEGGKVNFKANSIYKNEFGWWKCTDGKVTFQETGVFKNDYGWWRVKDSKVDFTANGFYKNSNGLWKTTNGKVTFKEQGLYENKEGTWAYIGSMVDFDYVGLFPTEDGLAFLEDGTVDYNYSGKAPALDGVYQVKDGQIATWLNGKYNGCEIHNGRYSTFKPVYYSQGDERWATAKIFGDTGNSMKKNGCGPTSLAMAFEGITGQTILPSTVAEWLFNNTKTCNVSKNKHGTYPKGLEAAARHWRIEYKGLKSNQAINEELAKGHIVIGAVGPNLKGLAKGFTHWVVMYGYEDGKTHVFDANNGKGNGVWETKVLWDNQLVDRPKDKYIFAGETGFVFYSFWK